MSQHVANMVFFALSNGKDRDYFDITKHKKHKEYININKSNRKYLNMSLEKDPQNNGCHQERDGDLLTEFLTRGHSSERENIDRHFFYV